MGKEFTFTAPEVERTPLDLDEIAALTELLRVAKGTGAEPAAVRLIEAWSSPPFLLFAEDE